jgi:hypothetical protein
MEDLTEFKMPEMANYNVKCVTDNCENKNLKIEIFAPAENPFIICGGCSQEITDITPVKAPKK